VLQCYVNIFFTERSKVVEKHVQNVTINFGPQHPAAHGVLRLVLTLDGEVGKPYLLSNSHIILCVRISVSSFLVSGGM